MTGKSYTDFICENYKRIRDTVQEACVKRGCSPSEITLCAATKTVDVEAINYAASLGLRCMGENKVQELTDKFDRLSPLLEKHFIGSLQKNKVKYLIDRVSLIQSLDSLSVAAEIQRLCEIRNTRMSALVELNVGKEEHKGGILPQDIPFFLGELQAFDRVEVRGLMTICPFCEKKDEYRKFFAETYQIFIDFFEKKRHNKERSVLSMGMSDNYDLAIEYGATVIRPGKALFGARNYGTQFENKIPISR